MMSFKEIFSGNHSQLSSKRIVGTAMVGYGMVMGILSFIAGGMDSGTKDLVQWIVLSGISVIGVGTFEKSKPHLKSRKNL